LKRERIHGVLAVGLIVSSFGSGCVRRTIIITTEPPKARVFLNDQELGRARVSTDFLWYGDYDVVIRKSGYKTLATHWRIKAPWYQRIPIDFVAEVLWPGHIHDVRTKHFVLAPEELPTSKEHLERAAATQSQAFQTHR